MLLQDGGTAAEEEEVIKAAAREAAQAKLEAAMAAAAVARHPNPAEQRAEQARYSSHLTASCAEGCWMLRQSGTGAVLTVKGLHPRIVPHPTRDRPILQADTLALTLQASKVVPGGVLLGGRWCAARDGGHAAAAAPVLRPGGARRRRRPADGAPGAAPTACSVPYVQPNIWPCHLTLLLILALTLTLVRPSCPHSISRRGLLC